MSEATISERVERAIAALEWIGDPLPGEISPNPENYSAAEKAKIIREHVMNVARLQMWIDFLSDTDYSNDPRTFLLWNLLELRVSQACQIISALQQPAN